MEKYFLILALGVVVLAAAFFIFRGVFEKSSEVIAADEKIVTIRGVEFIAEVARTIGAQTRGLSGRESLIEGRAMLFDFGYSAMRGFWMKDMKFPIDIIWIEGGRVIGFVENALPDDRPNRTVYYSPAPATMVLEVSAGTVDKNKIVEGDGVGIR